jgi:hypothetical protein
MYFDEDGDLAHEFYEEVTYGEEVEDGPRATMQRVRSQYLRPQVKIRLNNNATFSACSPSLEWCHMCL